MAAQTTLDLPAPAGANAVVITILVPSYAAVPQGTAIAASIDGTPVATACCFREGVSQAAFSIPHPSNAARRLRVTLTPSTRFVPAQRGLNHDPRTLSVLLRRVAVENTRTGRSYLDGVLVTAPAAPEGYLLWLLVTIGVGLVALSVTLRRPALGWVMLLLTAPFGYTGVTLLGVAAALLWQRASVRALGDPRTLALGGALALFVVAMILSSAQAGFPPDSVRATLLWAAYVPAFAVAAVAFDGDPDEALLRRTLSWVTIVVAALALAQLWYGVPESVVVHGHVVPRVAGPLEGPNQLGAYLGIMLPAIFAFAIRKRTIEEIFALAIGAIALALTFSRAGIVACVAAFALVLLFQLRSRAVVLAAVAVLFVAGGVVVAHASGAASLAAYNGGLGTRPALWHGAVVLRRQHPALGIGPSNYELEIGGLLPGVRTHPNSYYLQALAEEGVVGLVALLAVTVAAAFAFARRRDALGTALLAATTAFAFHQLVDGLLVYPKIGDALWILAGIACGAATLGISGGPGRDPGIAQSAIPTSVQ